MVPPINAALASRWIATGTLDDVALAIRDENIRAPKLARSVLGNADIAADSCGRRIWLRMPPHWRAALCHLTNSFHIPIDRNFAER